MFQKHIHKAKFYPSADDFTQALLVMLVTNIMSVTTDTELSSVLENRANEKQAVSDGQGIPEAIAKNREKDTFQPQRAVTDS